ncbi:MAG: hypothetical protein NVS9B11_23250 [Candidatus Dormibacteraceae bacterium]
MDPIAAAIWIATLAIIVVVVTPYVLYLCWRLVRAARNIERHFAVTLTAAAGIAGSTSHVRALEDTIAVASGMLETAGKIDEHSAAIENLLVSRLSQGAR